MMLPTLFEKLFKAILLFSSCVGFLACREEDSFRWSNPPEKSISGLRHIELKSQFVDEAVGLSIILPEDYENSPDKAFHVVYYLHGWGGDESSDYAGVAPFVKEAAAKLGAMPLIVFPHGGRSGYFGEAEKRIIQEVIPYIDNNFRVLKNKKGRTVLGFSVGGTAAMRLALKYPELFGSAASLGGRLWQNDNSLSEAVAHNHDILKAQQSELMFIQGEQDGPNQFDHIIAQMEQFGIYPKTVKLPKTEHSLPLYLQRSKGLYKEFLQKFFSSSAMAAEL